MAHFQSHYDNSGVHRTNEYGNPIVQTDEYGNLICPADEYGNPVYASGDPYGTTAGTGWQEGALPGTGNGNGTEHRKEHHTLGGMLHRSGSSSSSSSSSSEDDGHGGRRKKGLKEKIKEKLPGTMTTRHLPQPRAPPRAATSPRASGMRSGESWTRSRRNFPAVTIITNDNHLDTLKSNETSNSI